MHASTGLGALVLALSATVLTAPAEAATPTTDRAVSQTRDSADRGVAAKKPVRCHGKVATIVGNRRSNRLEGTPRRDVIVGRGGGDIIIGRGGNDLICGGRGGDVLIGLSGRDRQYGGPQKDQCFGEAREHRLHFGCEVHRNPLGMAVHHPGAPHKGAASGVARLADRLPAAKRRGVATSDRPYCEDGRITLGRFYFTASYQNPGWIAVRPVYAQWNEFAGGYGGDVAATDWQMYNAPADGQYYWVNMGAFNIGSGMSVWGYQVYWWNGAEWVDGQLVGIPKYDNAGASAAYTYRLGSCVT